MVVIFKDLPQHHFFCARKTNTIEGKAQAMARGDMLKTGSQKPNARVICGKAKILGRVPKPPI
jgi:hypothetical protein